MSNNNIVLYVNGSAYTGWLNVSITHSIESIASSFSLKAINSINSNEKVLPIVTGMECRIDYKGKTILTGYVDDTSIELSENSTLRNVTGRSKPADLVDCGVESLKDFKKVKLDTIVIALCKPFGISVTINSASVGNAFTEFKIQPGETAFEAIDRACKLQGFIVIGNETGGISVETIGKVQSSESIQEGINVISASFATSIKERFSTYIVKSQDSSTDSIFGEKTSSISSTVKDPLISRHRPIVIVAESITSKTSAKKRAEWECAVRRARSISIECTVPGWSAKNDIWKINTIVSFLSKSLGITSINNYIISNVTRTYDEGSGELTQLTLNPEGSFVPEPSEMLMKQKTDSNPFSVLKKK